MYSTCIFNGNLADILMYDDVCMCINNFLAHLNILPQYPLNIKYITIALFWAHNLHPRTPSTRSLNYTEWVIRFKSLDDEIPLLEVFDNSGRSEFSIREIVVPKHYKLESVLGDPLHYATSRGFRLESAL